MSIDSTIADIRKDYKLRSLSEKDVQPDPIDQFGIWWNDALTSNIPEINAMTLATASSNGIPSARVVLLKGYSREGFIFFTNYQSRKGIEIDENPHVALVFFWKELERQVRVSGDVEKIPAADSDAYFLSRPAGSRIGAWASPQSQIIQSRLLIEENAAKYTDQFKGEIPRPPHWGGYTVKPVEIEFWQGRSSRLHDRIHYSLENNNWKISRLAP